MKTLLILPCIALAVLSAFSFSGLPRIFIARGAISPIAAFTYFPCDPCAAPGDVVIFYGNWSTTHSSSSILNYTWNFGDGSPVVSTSNPVMNHDYFGIPGHWPVTLTVKDANGLSDTITHQVLFYVYPQFNFKPLKTFAGLPVSFNASTSIVYQSNNTITGYDWNFGDGTTGSGVVVSHSYSAPGIYRVILELRTFSGDASISKTILVEILDSMGGQIIPVDQTILILQYAALAAVITGVAIAVYYRTRKMRRARDSYSVKGFSQSASE